MGDCLPSEEPEIRDNSSPITNAEDVTNANCSPVEPGQDSNPAIDFDHSFIRETVPEAAILTLTKDFITVILIRTPYARVQLRIQYLPKYPDEGVLVELTSPSLPVPLLRNKEKAMMDLAKEHLGQPQVSYIYDSMNSFIQDNYFVPCWKEVKQVMTLCEGKCALAANEKEGLLQMRISCGNYRQDIKLRIPSLYPEEGVSIEFVKSNFPEDIQFMFRAQAEEIVRRCVAGFNPDQALNTSNPIDLPSNGMKGATGEKSVKFSAGSLKNMKHDVAVLKQISDLRDATSKKKKNQYFTEGNADRREARRDLRRLAKAEAEADEELVRQQRAEEQEEMKQLLRSKCSEVEQPSLLAAARFLVEDYATRLPTEVCQACRQPVLHPDPTHDSVTNRSSGQRPMRTFCGHWLHHHCLDEWLTTPPFIRQCPVCDRRIWHPDWPADVKQVEKAWQTKEARKREMFDVADFMGM